MFDSKMKYKACTKDGRHLDLRNKKTIMTIDRNMRTVAQGDFRVHWELIDMHGNGS